MSYSLALKIRNHKIDKAVAAQKKSGITDVDEAEKILVKYRKLYQENTDNEKNRRLCYWAMNVYTGVRILNKLPIDRNL